MENRIESTSYEEKAKEFVEMTFALCEQKAAHKKSPPSSVDKAMASAVLTVQESINTILAIRCIDDETEK